MSTVKVRIALAVDSAGEWGCCGWSTNLPSSEYDEQVMELAAHDVSNGEARYWIEVDAPLPPPAPTLGAVLIPVEREG